MPNRLPLPPEMQHLIEKRSGEERRVASSDADEEIVPTDEDKDAERRSADRRSDN